MLYVVEGWSDEVLRVAQVRCASSWHAHTARETQIMWHTDNVASPRLGRARSENARPRGHEVEERTPPRTLFLPLHAPFCL